LISENWLPITHRDISKAGGKGILNYYKDSHIGALVDAYPEIGLKNTDFPRYTDYNWKDDVLLNNFVDSESFQASAKSNWNPITEKELAHALHKMQKFHI